MADLITPHRAIGFKKRTKKGWAMPPKGKYHLMKHDGDPCGSGFTACNLIVWGPDEFLPNDSLFPTNRENAYDISEISSIPAERLCKKCLGPLKAED